MNNDPCAYHVSFLFSVGDRTKAKDGRWNKEEPGWETSSTVDSQANIEERGK